MSLSTEDLADSDEIPEISHCDVYYLASLYGIKSYMISFINNMKSFEDRVFHIGIYEKFINKKNDIIPLILKCSITQSFDRTDIQIKFMMNLYNNNVPSPKPVKLKLNHQNNNNNNNHQYIYITKNNPLINNDNINKKTNAYKVNVHCMSYVDGISTSEINKDNIQFLHNLGATIGKLSLSLQGFQHNVSCFEFMWDLQFALKAVDKLKYVENKNKLCLLNIYIDNYKNMLLPYINDNKLRKSIIHGDLNDVNMLCDHNDHTKIKCIFDFGDVVSSYTVFDIAICCSYYMLNTKNKHHSLYRMYNILYAYNNIYPLTNHEIDIFFVAVCSRIFVCVLGGAEKIHLHPQNKQHLETHSKPGWTFLKQFYDTNPVQIAKIIKKKLQSSNL